MFDQDFRQTHRATFLAGFEDGANFREPSPEMQEPQDEIEAPAANQDDEAPRRRHRTRRRRRAT